MVHSKNEADRIKLLNLGIIERNPAEHEIHQAVQEFTGSVMPTQKLYNPREPLLKVGLVQVFHRQYPLAFFLLTNHVPVASCSNAAIRAMFRFSSSRFKFTVE